MKKFIKIYNQIIAQQLINSNTAFSIPSIINILKSHGKIIKPTGKNDLIIVKDGYSQGSVWHDEVLKILDNGMIKSLSTGDIYKNILFYLGY